MHKFASEGVVAIIRCAFLKFQFTWLVRVRWPGLKAIGRPLLHSFLLKVSPKMKILRISKTHFSVCFESWTNDQKRPILPDSNPKQIQIEDLD